MLSLTSSRTASPSSSSQFLPRKETSCTTFFSTLHFARTPLLDLLPLKLLFFFLFFGLHSLLLLSKYCGFFFLLIFSVCCYCSVSRGPQLLLPCKFLPWTCSGSSGCFYLLLQLSSSSLRCCKLCLLLVLSSLLVVAAKGRCCFHCWSLLLP